MRDRTSQDVRLILRGITILLIRQEHMMAKFDELTQEVSDLQGQVTDLQATVDAREASDTALAAAQQAEIDRLTALLGTSVTDTQLQTVIDGLTAVKTGIQSASADIADSTND